MIEIKVLLDLYIKGRFEEVIKLSDECDDGAAKFLKVRSYIALGKFNQALQQYFVYQDIIEANNLIEAIKVLVYLLLKNGYSFEAIRDEIVGYKDFPQQNYETQEFLDHLDEYLDETFENYKAENIEFRTDKEQFIKTIKDGKYDELIDTINYAKREEDISFNLIEEIENYLSEHSKFSVKYGILLRELVLAKSTKNIVFTKGDKYYIITPSDLYEKLIKEDLLIKEIYDNISLDTKDVTVVHYLRKIVDITRDVFCPEYLNTYEDAFDYLAACLCIVYRLIGANPFEDHFVLESSTIRISKFENYYSLLKDIILKWLETV